MTTVLIVDDDDLVRQTLVVGLRAAGFFVLSASNGDDGLRIMNTEIVDVLVTDLVMPGREGIETITHLRREGCSIPIIAITGASTDGMMLGRDYSGLFLRAAGLLGATRTLAKPFTPGRLAAEIRDCLALSDASRRETARALSA